MDPISQTILTLVCMIGAFFWGLKQGTVKGAQATWEIVIDAFNAIHIDWNEETNELTFTREGNLSKTFKSSEAWKNESNTQR